MNNLSECDVLVVVVAAGIASLLAQQQRHVVVLEKERFPRVIALHTGTNTKSPRCIASGDNRRIPP